MRASALLAARCLARSPAASLARAGRVAPQALSLRVRSLSQAVANTVAEPGSLDGAAAASTAVASDEAAASTDAPDGAAADADGSPSAPAAAATQAASLTSGSALLHPSTTYRVKMLRAIKDRDFELVLNHYDDMVDSGVTPDILTLNCVIEAKAHNQGTVAARDTLQVCSRPLTARVRVHRVCSRPIRESVRLDVRVFPRR